MVLQKRFTKILKNKTILFASLIVIMIISFSVLIPDSFATVAPGDLFLEIPVNAFSPDCNQNQNCFVPQKGKTAIGSPIHVTNNDNYAHTMTSYYPNSNSTVFFDVTILPGEEITLYPSFDKEGEFYYSCKLYPWMKGSFIAYKWTAEIVLCMKIPDWFQQVYDLKFEGKISVNEYQKAFEWMHKNGLITKC